ncbi:MULTISPECIES: DUF998 domain-containing protein [Tsukamurella]|uniref:DUF998 domain-containing protein n=2 Tax=Tsukamurella TaxID=2060 RepID=A0A5C5RZR5_9ACTN|nr:MULTISPECIES: DUF998 domain-containing protein [Tsukamurella]NMD54132.1 DUF998 domain-containing protein [Tsukamurella columbiensis]TWS28334.1 DUF998 domain-containing protein [Tsukamurella conjunctivitidis]
MPLTIDALPRARPATEMSRRRTVLAGVLLVSTALYFLAELVVSLRWPRPYDWSRNMISDLGVPECLGELSRDGGLAVADRFVCSPWHPVMNTAFVVVGALGFAAAVALRPVLPRPWAALTLALAAVNGIALACVGLFPGSAGEFPDGPRARIVVHPIAAYVEHVTGLALMAVAVLLLVRTRTRLAALTALFIAVSGLAALVIPWANPLGAGGTERAAIDPFLWWRCALGIALLAVARRSRTSDPKAPDPITLDLK